LFVFVAISRRKLEMPVEQIISAVNSLDLKVISLENVEILQRMVPTEQEVRIFGLSIHIVCTPFYFTKKNNCTAADRSPYVGFTLNRVRFPSIPTFKNLLGPYTITSYQL